MKRYELREHTADVVIYAESDTLKGLFKVSTMALSDILLKDKKKADIEEKIFSINLASLDTSALLVEFLSEALYLMDTNNIIINEVTISELSDSEITASLLCTEVYGFDESVKAVTYHEANIEFVNGIYSTNIILDI